MHRHLTWEQVTSACSNIADQLNHDNFKPDFIVGISRGGLIPATILSHLLNIPLRPLIVSLRDGNECVSDCGLAEDAFGYSNGSCNKELCKRILIIDDINDSGNTINWIKKDWANSVYGNNFDPFRDTVKIATLINKQTSNAVVDYASVHTVSTDWIIFPWENNK